MKLRDVLIVSTGLCGTLEHGAALAQTSTQIQSSEAVDPQQSTLDEAIDKRATAVKGDRTQIVDPTGTPGVDNKNDIVVVGIRGSVASAANKKRKSKQIVDSVVSEDVGKLPDNNVPEALSRVTGVQITRERGQGQSVSIRGLSQVQTTINGNNTNLGDGRGVNLADIPAELLKAVDVYKTRSPDQAEGGIAGTVNVELRRPLDLKKGWTVAGSMRGVYDDISEKVSPSGSLLVSDRLDTGIGEIGFLINSAFSRTKYRENYVESESPDDPASLPNVVIPYRAYYGLEQGHVDRPSVNAALQWRPSNTIDFVLEGGYLGSREKRSMERLYIQAREGAYAFSNVVLKPDGKTIKSLTVTDPNGLAAGVDSLYNSFFSNLYTSNFETHWHSGIAQINASVQYNQSTEGNYVVEQVLRPGALTSANVDFASDRYPGGVPAITFNDTNLADPLIYTVERFHDETGGSKNKEFAGQTDLTLNLSDKGLLRTFQSGFRYSRRVTSRHNGYRDGLPRVNGERPSLADFPGGAQASLVDLNLAGSSQWFRIPGTILRDNIDAIRAYIQANDPGNAERFSSVLPPSNLGQTFDSRESTFAYYGQVNYAATLGFPIDGLVGVRYVNTWGTSNSFNYRPGDATNDFQDVVLSSPGRGNYVNILPSATGIIHFAPKAQLRLSYSTNVSRPSFYDMRPFFYADTRQTPPVIDAGNPQLKAQRDHSFDASAEYYFGRGGQLTLAGYYKKATGFLYFSREVANDLSAYGLPGQSGFIQQQRNAGSGEFAGIEGTAQTFFDFLPGLWRNFGVTLNASYIIKARVEYPYPEDFPGAFDSPDTSKYTANATLLYDTPRLSARLAFNYRSSYRLGVFTDNPAYSPYSDDVYRMDAAINFTPVEFMTLSLEGSNLLGNDVYRYFGKEKLLPLGVRTLAKTVQASARFRF